MTEPQRNSDPRALEVAGAETVTFEFRGLDITIPFPLEAWPLDDIAAGRNGRALKSLLAGQRPAMRIRSDAVELSHRMADACGMTPVPHHVAEPGAYFGAVPALLYRLQRPDDVEADLRRFYRVDYRDRWRAGLTLRQIWVMLRRLPHDAALLVDAQTGDLPWTRADIIGARSWEMFTRQWYPGRPLTREENDQAIAKQAAEQAEMDDLADRERYYATGQNMADAGVDPGDRSAVDTALDQARRNAAAHNREGNTDGQPRRRTAAVDAARRIAAESNW